MNNQYKDMFNNPTTGGQMAMRSSGKATTNDGKPILVTDITPVAFKPQLPVNFTQKGRNHVDKINQITDQVTAKIKMSDTSELGKGVTEILALTSSVDMSKIEDADKSFLGRITNTFRNTKVKLLAQYDTAKDHVDRIVVNLKKELDSIDTENKWLADMYTANLTSLNMLQVDVMELLENKKQQAAHVAYLESIQNRTNQQDEDLHNERFVLEQLSKHIDRLERLVQIGVLNAPDLRSLQKNNYDATSDFNDIIDVTIPQWKHQLTLALLAARQVKRAEMSNAIKDRNNELMRKRADMMHDASVQTAMLSQRSSVADVDTLEYVQEKLVNRLTETRRIESEARSRRESDLTRILENREKMKIEMQKW